MSEDVYHLKKLTYHKVLNALNNMGLSYGERIARAIICVPNGGYPDLDEMRDWLDAIESGKKIVNPLSPREEIRAIRNKYCQQIRADGRKILIEQHDYCLLLLYAEKAVEEGEADESQD